MSLFFRLDEVEELAAETGGDIVQYGREQHGGERQLGEREEEEKEELIFVHRRLEVMRAMLLEETMRTREFVRTHHLKRAIAALADVAYRMKR